MRSVYVRVAVLSVCDLCVLQDTLCLKLLRRKNLLRGTTIRRKCCCAASKNMCPIHVLWHDFFDDLERRCKPWARISACDVRRKLRGTVNELKVPCAASFATHDFRRGHAKDLQLSGAPLAKILAAGQWRSAAFLKYLDECDLEK